MEIKKKEPTEEDDSVTLVATTPKAHYDAVKMKYFSSLGMNKPAQMPEKRERGKTAPHKIQLGFEQIKHQEVEFDDDEAFVPAHRKKRSISSPGIVLHSQAAIPIPMGREPLRNHLSDSDSDSDSEDEDGKKKKSSKVTPRFFIHSKFIPPHEMMAQKDSFQVGTARSLAVWETRRRANLNVI